MGASRPEHPHPPFASPLPAGGGATGGHDDESVLEQVEGPPSSLLDAVDRLISKGTLLRGNVLISIADVDLIWLDLGLILAAVETLEQSQKRRGYVRESPSQRREARRAAEAERPAGPSAFGPFAGGHPPQHPPGVPRPAPGPGPVRVEPASPPAGPPPANAARIALDQKTADKGVARLVLTLVEFVRRLLERQAIRRMEGGLLSDDTVERMGEALARLEEKVAEMGDSFGLRREDLDLDLGPLGRLSGPDSPPREGSIGDAPKG